MAKLPNLKQLSAADLNTLIDDAQKRLRPMIENRRAELAKEMSELDKLEGLVRNGRKAAQRITKGRKVAAKYRHPKTGETYAGRGAMAGWLKAELKAGKKLEDFLIDRSAAKKPARKKNRKAA